MALGSTVLLIVCSLLGGSQAAVVAKNPGMITYINDVAFGEYHQKVAFYQDLHEKLANNPIPEISGSLQGFFLSELSYVLRDLKVVEYDPLRVNYSISKSDGIVLWIHAPRVVLEGKHSINHSVGGWPLTLSEQSGDISITLKDIRLRLVRDVQIAKDKAKWVSTSANVSVDDVKIDLNDKAANDILASLNQQDLRRLVEEKILSSHMVLTDTEYEIAYNITDNISLDVSLLSKPVIHDRYLELHHVGVVRYRGDNSVFKDKPGAFAPLDFNKDPTSGVPMMTFRISDNLLNSLGWVIHKHRLLASVFTDEDLPEDQRELLATTCDAGVGCFGEKFPEAGIKFPNSSIWFNISSAEPLKVTMDKNKINVTTSLNVDAHAREKDGTSKLLFSIGARLIVPIEFKIINSKLHIVVQRPILNITFHVNNIGDITIDDLEPILEPVLHKLLSPVLDWLRREGLPLIVPKPIIVTEYEVMLNKRDVSIEVEFMKEPRLVHPIVLNWD